MNTESLVIFLIPSTVFYRLKGKQTSAIINKTQKLKILSFSSIENFSRIPFNSLITNNFATRRYPNKEHQQYTKNK